MDVIRYTMIFVKSWRHKAFVKLTGMPAADVCALVTHVIGWTTRQIPEFRSPNLVGISWLLQYIPYLGTYIFRFREAYIPKSTQAG